MKATVRRLRFILHNSSFIILFLLAACSRTAPPAGLVIVNGPEPESLDPALITAQADGRIVASLFEGLTRYDPKTAMPEPGLAERWEVSPDGKTYTFFIRSNAVWSTGGPVTAHDVVYSWRRVLDPLTAAEYAGQLFYLKNGEEFNSARTNAATSQRFTAGEVGVRALDDRTLRVELNNPTAFFLDLCAFQTLAVVPRQWIERHGDRWLMTPPVPVSGAYLLDAWRINDKIRLCKNPRYWDAANTRTEIVDLLPCSSANTALNLYETGAADIVWDKSLVPSEMLDVLLKRPDFHSFDYLGTYFFRFNVTRKPFDDPRVRKALALAVDKRRIVQKITRGGEKPASAFTPPGVAGYRPPEGLGYSPDEARRLLAEAGYPGGKSFPRFQYMLDAKLHEQIGVELQAMWRSELGLNVELRQIETKAYYRAQSELDYDLCRSSWIGDYNDANTFLDMFMSNNGNNRTGWKHARYDQLVREANAQVDATRREKLLQEAEVILIREEAPVVPLYIYVGLEYYDGAKITGIHPNIRGEHPLRAIGRGK